MREYFGLINGCIPRSITNELPFLDMCCTFEGYLPRFEGCGCCVYETDDSNSYILQTECKYNGTHKTITRDPTMSRWSIHRSSIHLLHEKIRYLEMCIPIKNYAYLDPEYDVNITDELLNIQKDLDDRPDGRHTTDKDIIHKVFMWCVMMEILVAFERYRIDYTITFTSECV